MKLFVTIKSFDNNMLAITHKEKGSQEVVEERVRIEEKNGILRVHSSLSGCHVPYTSIWTTGSVSGMRRMYSHWEKAKVVRAFNSFYNVSVPKINHGLDLLAYALEFGRADDIKYQQDTFLIEYSFQKTFHIEKTKKQYVKF